MTGNGRTPEGPGDSGDPALVISPGDRVLFIDGRFAGEVLEADGDRFELDFAGDPVWVAGRSVFTAADGRITLICDADGLHRYIMPW